MRFFNTRGRGPRPLPRIALAVGMLTLPLAACDTDSLLEVEDPEFASPETLNNEAGVPILIATALGDFQIAYSGDGNGNDGYLSNSSNFTDEMYNADTFETRTAIDRRDLFPSSRTNESDDAFEFLQLARRSADLAADAVERFFGADDPRIARLRSLEGFTYVALAEGFCSAIPFSETTDVGAPGEFGEPLSTAQVFGEALARFDAALGADANSNLAAVGRARTLLNLGRYQEAAGAVAGVPTTFVYKIEHSSNTFRQNNPIYSLQDNGRYSVSDEEGINGLPYRSALDPRIPWVEDPDGGFDANIDLFLDLRYPSVDADVPLASGVEARLIEAEAALQRGDINTWLAKLNGLRETVFSLMAIHFDEYDLTLELAREAREEAGADEIGFGELEPLTDPGLQEARVDLMFRERAFWLYTTGHRLGDLRRLTRPVSEGGYGRALSEVFPTGAYAKGGEYGDDVAFSLPAEESNNSNFRPGNCNTTRP